MRRLSRKRQFFSRARLAGLCAVLAASTAPTLPAGRAADADPVPIRFQDLSALSGGPLDFGAPRSNLETAACVFFDADGDGWDDFVTLNGRGEQEGYFLNRSDGAGGRAFVPAPPGNGLDTGACPARDGGCVTAGDVDGDGDEDLFVGFGWNEAFEAGEGENALFLNDGAGNFTEVTADAGLLDGDHSTLAAFFFDMDLDGDLDLFTCNTDFSEQWKDGDGRVHLWRNEFRESGKLRFAEEAALRGLVETGDAVWAATGVDHDGDGDFDVLVSHDIAGETQLFVNDGRGYFTEVTHGAGSGEGDDETPSTFGDDAYSGMGVAWGDYDNDGDLDPYITNIGRNPLYRNNGDGTFTDVADRTGVRGHLSAWGCSFQDFDLDGFVDLYVAGGDTWNFARPDVRSFVYRNRGDRTFEDASSGAGLRHDAPLHREGGTACADYDRDGRIDLLVTRADRAGASPYLYRNVTETGPRRWLTLALRGNGVATNTSAIGAKITVVPRDAAGDAIPGLTQFHEINGGDSRGSRSALAQTFGLGAAAVTADVTVVWPRAGTVAVRGQTWTGLPLDQRIELTEGPRLATWRLAPEATAVVASKRGALLKCTGIGEKPDPLTRVVVMSGPSWVTPGAQAKDGASTLLVLPPDVATETTYDVTLKAVAQWADDAESRQTLHLTVRPVPRITSVKRVGSRLYVYGVNLQLSALELRVGDVLVAPTSVRATRLKARMPATTTLARTTSRRVTVEIRDPSTGVRSQFRARL